MGRTRRTACALASKRIRRYGDESTRRRRKHRAPDALRAQLTSPLPPPPAHVDQIPPSLRNMYKELTNDIEGFKAPAHGYLQSWAEQGACRAGHGAAVCLLPSVCVCVCVCVPCIASLFFVSPLPRSPSRRSPAQRGADGEPGRCQLAQGPGTARAATALRPSSAGARPHRQCTPAQGWEQFTDAVIDAVNKRCDNVVFLLWGNYAKKKGAKVDKVRRVAAGPPPAPLCPAPYGSRCVFRQKRHCVLTSGHPSPLSVRFFDGMELLRTRLCALTLTPLRAHPHASARSRLCPPPCAPGCKHFSKANDYLRSKNRAPINWKSVMEA